MSHLRLDSLSMHYGAKQALSAISLDVPQGEFLCVLGPSGCGKTTLLNLLAGIAQPSSGRIYLQGKDITQLPPEKRQVGMVFQHYALFPNLSVAENICYGLRGPKWPKHEQKKRADHLLQVIGLTDFATALPANLSGGQQQRVALARALAPYPAFLLLDEPLSAVDAQVRHTLGPEIARIQRKSGVTAIMVTHDQAEALALADRVLLMNKGCIEQCGTPEDLYRQPATRFAAEFIGCMNIITHPSCNQGKPIALRYEDVYVTEATEFSLAQPHTFVAKVEHRALLGNCYRLELLLNDFTTRIFADVPNQTAENAFLRHSLLAVTLPQAFWRTWE